MKNSDSTFVDIQNLRIGLYVELDLGWTAHPFRSGSFKITSTSQIDTIRSLGLSRVRYVLEKSDPEIAPLLAVTGKEQQEERTTEPAQQAALARKNQSDLLLAQQHSMAVCERRFGDTARECRKTFDLIPSQPLVAGQQCATMVAGFVGELLSDGESVIRLLSEAAADKVVMHPVNVAVMSLLLGKSLGLNPVQMHDLGVAAFLHDIGKTALPERVRWLDDKFSSVEHKLFQEHVLHSVQLAKTMGLSQGAVLAIAQHHELMDGSGFPSRAKSESIPIVSRILALVNRYDSLCNPGRTAAAMTPHEALSLIFTQLKSRFDSNALSAFIRMMGVYPPGSVVQLVDERYASVVAVNTNKPLKPNVLVFTPGVPKHEALILDLEQSPTLGIRRSLKPANLPSAALDYLAPRSKISYFFEHIVRSKSIVA